jgi:2-keto-3-deoxy-L-rhamnonate aldolase RhmA
MNLDKTFRSRVLKREWVGGTFINLGSPLTVEMAGCAGFDWLLLDHEHGPGSDQTLLHQLQAASTTRAVPIVRIAANEAPRFKRVLDIGAAGVMVPWVNNATEAKAAVSAMRYPPRGLRGVAKLNRACDFGVGFEDYYAHAHEWLVLMAQIETPESVANAAEIAAVDGIDVLFIGPMDLTTTMGIQSQFDHPDYLAAVRKVTAAATAAGKATGILLLSPAQLPLMREIGISVVALGSDGGAVNAALRQLATTVKGK